ncbi:ribosomal-protein-alanine N-acetyltransferase [Rhodobium orientis]|uniref:Ribosomal-protein-alanine N-acetyltransferase n=1 Tax=Rhodobium orientis TaxID=34017 RepID=A0A327JIE3_9HYPH|nr:ribosomal protein S18-alanine N-acetyltransferase [Rhodobium orientis]MBB4304504.1 ribosomal-protein-alanine N-acetyltransferase [Rhodobium orientis]MBK5948095.1 ribosomal-protein-alanine N-acetyltransferase [Rhodobium orientis]RAI26177.1 ribosomal-protein-alanine N-acetyltransferase [Rhodobium orientis]
MWWLLQIPTLVDAATEDDVAALSEIHTEAFEHTWSEEEIAALLRQENVIGLAARRSSLFAAVRPVGFVMVRTAADEAEILTIAVSPSCRRRGIGRQLVEAVLRKLYADRIAELYLEVDVGNIAAVGLYRSLGFREVGERIGYYGNADGERSTALVMKRELR